VEPLTLILGLLVLALTGAAGFLAQRNAAHAKALAVLESKTESLEADAAQKIEAARNEARIEGKEQLAQDKARLQAERQVAAERLKVDRERVAERVAELDRRAERAERREDDLGRREQKLADRERSIEQSRTDLEQRAQTIDADLARISELSPEQARKELLARVEEEAKPVLARRIAELEEEVKERAERTAKNVISMAIQRYAGEYVCERTVSVVNLPSDELKGRIIGREGRNIRALEAATGVDFIIDDTPGTIVISAFNPIRREVAKAALEVLLEDGRIHPSRIEQVVRKAEAEFHRTIKAAGEEAANEVGVSGIHPEILKLIGALKYRTSYGQNQWQHAIEVSFLCGMMANELGLDVKKAKRAGLLHDIGKVLDQTAEGSHALIGAEFARKYGEKADVINAIAAHHEEVPQTTIYACLAQAADAISGARPGARREMMHSYTQRLDDLEAISNSFPGVERSYAVQAGREVRVLVENSQVTDEEAVLLSRGIAQKIESEMSYPGQIKVTVIRETRVVQYAR
jgi:ribonuclease Y